MSTPLMPGAEPISIDGGSNGVLLIHGYGGTPQEVIALAAAFARAGFSVEVPLMPGHGTLVDEMLTTNWSDYARETEDAYRKLTTRCQNIIVGGLSSGVILTAWLILEHPEIAGLISINGMFKLPRGGSREILLKVLEKGLQYFPTEGTDIADPQAFHLKYDKTPIAPMLSIVEALEDVVPRLGEISCPVLNIVSLQDNVAPGSGGVLAEKASGPVEDVLLERGGHVATVDYDRAILEARAVEFARAVVQGKFTQSIPIAL